MPPASARAARRRAAAIGSTARRCSSPMRTSPTFIVAAFRSRGAGESGVCLFLVPRDAPGVSVAPLQSIDQTRRPCEVVFRNVEVPSSALLADDGKGWKVLQPRDRRRLRRPRRRQPRWRATRARDERRVREGARAVRSADRLVSGDQAHRRRDGERDRAGALARVVRRVRLRPRAAARRRAPRRWPRRV